MSEGESIESLIGLGREEDAEGGATRDPPRGAKGFFLRLWVDLEQIQNPDDLEQIQTSRPDLTREALCSLFSGGETSLKRSSASSSEGRTGEEGHDATTRGAIVGGVLRRAHPHEMPTLQHEWTAAQLLEILTERRDLVPFPCVSSAMSRVLQPYFRLMLGGAAGFTNDFWKIQ